MPELLQFNSNGLPGNPPLTEMLACMSHERIEELLNDPANRSLRVNEDMIAADRLSEITEDEALNGRAIDDDYRSEVLN